MYKEKIVHGKDCIGIKLNQVKYSFSDWFNEFMEQHHDKEHILRGFSRIVKDHLNDILCFLKSIHSSGKIFNNLKPERIYIGEDKKIKIADFTNMETLGDEVQVKGRGSD